MSAQWAAGNKGAGMLLFQLLQHKGRIEEAEGILRELIASYPGEQRLYMYLAGLRIAGEQPLAAIQALEQGLDQSCSVPGRCGSTPPAPELLAWLASLYFEHGVDEARGKEVAKQALSNPSLPTKQRDELKALMQGRGATP